MFQFSLLVSLQKSVRIHANTFFHLTSSAQTVQLRPSHNQNTNLSVSTPICLLNLCVYQCSYSILSQKPEKAQCINLISRLCSSVYPSVFHSICTPIRPSVRVGAHQHTHESLRNDLAQGGHESASSSTPITQPCRPSGASALTRMRGQRKLS